MGIAGSAFGHSGTYGAHPVDLSASKYINAETGTITSPQPTLSSLGTRNLQVSFSMFTLLEMRLLVSPT